VIKTYDPASGAVRTVVNDTGAGAGTRSLGPLAWSVDGRLAYIEYDPQRPCVDLHGGLEHAADRAGRTSAALQPCRRPRLVAGR
jgi:hypothetical protein